MARRQGGRGGSGCDLRRRVSAARWVDGGRSARPTLRTASGRSHCVSERWIDVELATQPSSRSRGYAAGVRHARVHGTGGPEPTRRPPPQGTFRYSGEAPVEHHGQPRIARESGRSACRRRARVTGWKTCPTCNASTRPSRFHGVFWHDDFGHSQPWVRQSGASRRSASLSSSRARG